MKSLFHSLTNIFKEKFEVDDRLPLFRFHIGSTEYGIKAPSPLWWMQLILFFTMTASAYAAIWTITFKRILNHPRSNPSFVLGYGFLLPLITYIPFLFADLFDIRNTFQRFMAVTLYPVLTFFKTMEAMYGFAPRGVDGSIKTYLLYNAAALELDMDENNEHKIKNASSLDKRIVFVRFLQQYLILGFFLSFLSNYNYEVFESDIDANIHPFYWNHLMDLNLVLNNILLTILIQQTLTVMLSLLSFLASTILGIKVNEAMSNPVFTASSPSDFWGRKWNLVVHGVLKRGVFKPVYSSCSSKVLAVLATFVASGAFHEYILLASFPAHLQAGTPTIGIQTKFMAWNAFIICVEGMTYDFAIFQWMKRSFHPSIVTFLVISTAMPVAHWFLHPISKTKLLHHSEIAFPILFRMNKND